MVMQVAWNRIEQAYEQMTSDGLSPQTSLAMRITPKGADTITRKIHLKDFLPAMWFLYDNPKNVFSRIRVMRSDNGDVVYSFDAVGKFDQQLPIVGDPVSVLHWNNRVQAKKRAQLKVLVAQIRDIHEDYIEDDGE